MLQPRVFIHLTFAHKNAFETFVILLIFQWSFLDESKNFYVS